MFGKRLKIFIDNQHLSVRAFEKLCGVNQGTLSRIIKKNSAITSENLTLVVQYWKELDVNWLLTGDGEMLKKVDISIKQDLVYSKNEINDDIYNGALERANKEIEWQRKQIDLLTSIIKRQADSAKGID